MDLNGQLIAKWSKGGNQRFMQGALNPSGFADCYFNVSYMHK